MTVRSGGGAGYFADVGAISLLPTFRKLLRLIGRGQGARDERLTAAEGPYHAVMLDLVDRFLSALTGLDFIRHALRLLTGKPKRGSVQAPEPETDGSPALVAGHGASTTESMAGFAKVDLPDSFWGYQPPKPLQPVRRIGWLVVGGGVFVLVVFAVYLAIILADLDPDDPGSADILFVLSPMLAVIDAIVIGLLLTLVAARRLVPLTVARASRALAAGVILGPLVYLTLLFVGASWLDAAHSGLIDAIVGSLVPTTCALGATLIAAVIRRPRGSQGIGGKPSLG